MRGHWKARATSHLSFTFTILIHPEFSTLRAIAAWPEQILAMSARGSMSTRVMSTLYLTPSYVAIAHLRGDLWILKSLERRTRSACLTQSGFSQQVWFDALSCDQSYPHSFGLTLNYVLMKEIERSIVIKRQGCLELSSSWHWTVSHIAGTYCQTVCLYAPISCRLLRTFSIHVDQPFWAHSWPKFIGLGSIWATTTVKFLKNFLS